MRKMVWGAVLGMLVGAPLVARAAAGTDEKEFRAALEHKRMVLRSFSGEAEVRVRWDGKTLAGEDPAYRQLSAMEIEHVRFKSHRVELDGPRLDIFEGDSAPEFKKSTRRMHVVIALEGAGETAPLMELSSKLFFATLPEAFAALPTRFEGRLPLADASKKTMRGNREEGCDCGETACDPEGPMRHVKPPKLVRSGDPEFSEEARRKKINGSAEVGIVVSAQGEVGEVWLVRDLGFGLGEQAVAAARQYQFQPATCHGEPVSVGIFVSVNFRIF